MFGTFIGPGGIFMMIAGACETVFGLSGLLALGLNLVPILLFMLACYYTDSKFQLAFAKLLTLLYMMIMLAVYVGLLIQIFDEGMSLCHFDQIILPLPLLVHCIYSYILLRRACPHLDDLHVLHWAATTGRAAAHGGELLHALHARLPGHHPLHVYLARHLLPLQPVEHG